MKRLFATQFPIASSTTLEELLALEKKWIAGSPYTSFNQADLSKLINDGDLIKSGNNFVSLNTTKTNSYSALGLAYKIADSKNEAYQSTVVGRKSKNNFWVSVVLAYFSSSPKVGTYHKKPHLIKQIFDEIGGGMDGDISVSDEPIYLKNGDEEFVAEILTGNAKTLMPILYMSRNENDFCSLNPEFLAKYLSGISNVLVEPAGEEFSFKLKNLTNGENVFNGAIGVYWPDGSGRYFWLSKNIIPRQTEKEIYKTITEALIPRRLQKTLTLENIQDINHSKKLEELRKKIEEIPPENGNALDEMKQYIELQDNEIKRLGERNTQLEEKVSSLEVEHVKFPVKTEYGGEILKDIEVEEIYAGEVKEIVLGSLASHTAGIPRMSRRKVILEKIIASNPNENKADEMKTEIKRLFTGYTHLTSTIKRSLERMGFAVSDQGMHYKVYVEGDEGGVCSTIPKSGSDVRGGKNSASELIKTFF